MTQTEWHKRNNTKRMSYECSICVWDELWCASASDLKKVCHSFWTFLFFILLSPLIYEFYYNRYINRDCKKKFTSPLKYELSYFFSSIMTKRMTQKYTMTECHIGEEGYYGGEVSGGMGHSFVLVVFPWRFCVRFRSFFTKHSEISAKKGQKIHRNDTKFMKNDSKSTFQVILSCHSVRLLCLIFFVTLLEIWKNVMTRT